MSRGAGDGRGRQGAPEEARGRRGFLLFGRTFIYITRGTYNSDLIKDVITRNDCNNKGGAGREVKATRASRMSRKTLISFSYNSRTLKFSSRADIFMTSKKYCCKLHLFFAPFEIFKFYPFRFKPRPPAKGRAPSGGR